MKTWVLTILLMSIGAVGCHRDPTATPAELEKERLANSVLHKAAAKIKEKTGLHPCGTIGQMMREVQVLGLSFYHYRPVDIIEGRKLLVKAVSSLMEEVNQEKRIHPYLARYPFLPRNIEIQIFIATPSRGDVAPGNLAVVEASEGYLVYDIRHPTGNGFITTYKETYEEALERIKDPSLPLVPFQPSTSKISKEELARLRKGISFVSDDGSILYLDEKGCWTKERK